MCWRRNAVVLLVHYGIRGFLHNAPFDGHRWTIENVVAAARRNLAEDSGPFDRAFLYLAYDDGQLFALHP